jgi:hypothetical protein
MLRRVDRVQVVAQSTDAVAAAWEALLGARRLGVDSVESLRARRTTLELGESRVEVLQPTGPGPAADHLGAWGPGLFAAGFAVDDLAQMRERLAAAGARWTEEGDQILIEPGETHGLRMVLTRDRRQPAGGGSGRLRCLYEVSHLVRSWKDSLQRHVELFGLDPARFCPIDSENYGYTGSLLLFDPPRRLDRIELCQITDPERPMGRFYRKRGESLYMCYAECDDVRGLLEHLRARGARVTVPRDPADPPNLFVHPSALGGVLMGVSRTGYAWTWSGRPELAGARPAATPA